MLFIYWYISVACLCDVFIYLASIRTHQVKAPHEVDIFKAKKQNKNKKCCIRRTVFLAFLSFSRLSGNTEPSCGTTWDKTELEKNDYGFYCFLSIFLSILISFFIVSFGDECHPPLTCLPLYVYGCFSISIPLFLSFFYSTSFVSSVCVLSHSPSLLERPLEKPHHTLFILLLHKVSFCICVSFSLASQLSLKAFWYNFQITPPPP